MQRLLVVWAGLLLVVGAVGAAAAQQRPALQSDAGNWFGAAATGAHEPAFRAPVQAGDFKLNFFGQIEADFEQRDNYDFNDDLQDAGSRVDNFIEQESRWGMDAVADRFKFHLMVEQEELFDRDVDADPSFFHLERAWGQYSFDWFDLRVGLQLFSADPVGLVYADDDWGVRVFKAHPGWSWNLAWFKKQSADGEAVGAGPGQTLGTGGFEDQDIFVVNAEFQLPNLLGEGSLMFTPFFVHNRDRRPLNNLPAATGLSTTAADVSRVTAGGARSSGQDVYYLGFFQRSKLGPLATRLGFAYAFGNDDTGISSATLQDTDISAWNLFADVAYPIGSLTLTAGVFVNSGDDDPNDGDANGYAAQSDFEIFGSDALWVDDQIKVLGVADDNIIPEGLSGAQTTRIRNGGVNAVSGFVTNSNATTPIRATGFYRPGGGQFSLQQNFGNPGMIAVDLRANYRATDTLALELGATYFRLYTNGGLFGFDGPVNPGNAGTVPSKAVDSEDLGYEVNAKAVWRFGKYFRLTPTLAIFIPGEATEQLAGADDVALHGMIEAMWVF